VRASSKLAMADACSSPCAAQLKSVRDYVGIHGEGQVCACPQLGALQGCLNTLSSYVESICSRSMFTRTFESCQFTAELEKSTRRLQISTGHVTLLPDGTRSMNLNSLDKDGQQMLSSALTGSQGDLDSVDLREATLLFNTSKSQQEASPSPVLLDSRELLSPRRLGAALTDCRTVSQKAEPHAGHLCYGIAIAKKKNEKV